MSKVFRTKSLFTPSFLSMEYIEIVPDIDDDDYDDDNSLASLFCLCCAALGRAHPCRGKQAALAESCEKHRKNFEKLRNLSCVLEKTSSSFASFQKQRLSLLCGLATAKTSGTS